MTKRHVSRKKPLTLHQKQIRFLTGLSVSIGFAFIFTVFWYLNRPGIHH